MGGKACRKNEVNLSKLWNTKELCHTGIAAHRGPMLRAKLALYQGKLLGKNVAWAMQDMFTT